MKKLKNILYKFSNVMLCFLMFALNVASFGIGIQNVEAIDNNTYGIVYFRTKSCGTNTNFTVDGIGRAGYTNGCYGADGAFLGYWLGSHK